MKDASQRFRHALIVAWTLAVACFIYMPAVAITLASLTDSRYFLFPIQRWGFSWWEKTRPHRDAGLGGGRLLRRARLRPL
jgi:spermidine/putrescine transport system permease protein